jgi:hypothetical protein
MQASQRPWGYPSPLQGVQIVACDVGHPVFLQQARQPFDSPGREVSKLVDGAMPSVSMLGAYRALVVQAVVLNAGSIDAGGRLGRTAGCID